MRFSNAAVFSRVSRPRPGGVADGPWSYHVGGPNGLDRVVPVAAELVLTRRGRGAARRLLQPRQPDRRGADAKAGGSSRLRRGAACPHAEDPRGGGTEARVLAGRPLGKWKSIMAVAGILSCNLGIFVPTPP